MISVAHFGGESVEVFAKYADAFLPWRLAQGARVLIGQASMVYGTENHVNEKRDQQIILPLLSCRKSSINPHWGGGGGLFI